jgi:hypothetical protein
MRPHPLAGRENGGQEVANQGGLKQVRDRDRKRQSSRTKEVLVKKLGRGLLKRRRTKREVVPVVHAVTIAITFVCPQMVRPLSSGFQLRAIRGLGSVRQRLVRAAIVRRAARTGS